MESSHQEQSDTDSASLPQPRGAWPRSRWRAVALLIAYVVVLALIVLWPSPVDRSARGLLAMVTDALPVLTYARIEFAANIALFLPLGALAAVILPRDRHLVLPIALVVTVAVESTQAVLLAERTPSVLDIVANVTGACVGLLAVAAAASWKQRSRGVG